MSAMSIHLAPAALERIQGFLSADDSAIGLRFGVQRTGCSGWGYLADLAREQRDGDTVFEQDGVRIFVDADSLALVDGTRIRSEERRVGKEGVRTFRSRGAPLT